MEDFEMYKFKIAKMMDKQPIYDHENVEPIGYTEIGDMAIITYSENDYYETVITSGKYIGVDTLVLNNEDLKKAIFVN
jgi:hypothetical protein